VTYDTAHPGVPYTGFRDPHEQTGSDGETETVQTFHEGDLVQVTAFTDRGKFAKVEDVFPNGNVVVQLVFEHTDGGLLFFPHELKLIRAAEKPGWERHGMVRNCHKWRMWKGQIGWTAVQPFQCDGPLFRTGYGYGSKSYRRTFDELALAIAKGEAELHLKEALS
jgi:hypothetical protein